MDRIRLLQKTIDKHGETMQTVIAIEEMAELTKELSKDLRGENNREAIIEELADVYVMLEQIEIMHNIRLKELIDQMNITCLKIENILNGEEEHESV